MVIIVIVKKSSVSKTFGNSLGNVFFQYSSTVCAACVCLLCVCLFMQFISLSVYTMLFLSSVSILHVNFCLKFPGELLMFLKNTVWITTTTTLFALININPSEHTHCTVTLWSTWILTTERDKIWTNWKTSQRRCDGSYLLNSQSSFSKMRMGPVELRMMSG